MKRRYAVGVGGQRGYTPFGIETAKDANALRPEGVLAHRGATCRQAIRYHAFMPENVWPSRSCRSSTPRSPGLFNALDGLGREVLEAIAAYSRSWTRQFFDATVNLGNSILRLLHYPPVPKDGRNIRAGAHEDINVITLLLGAEEAGLEVLDRDGQLAADQLRRPARWSATSATCCSG